MSVFNLIEVELGAAFIGFTISLWLYGTTLSQTIYYFRTFPDDTRTMKFLVCSLCVADTLHVYLLSHMFWNYLVYGRSIGFSILLTLQWQLPASFAVAWFVTTVVQCFFGLRVWRVSSKNMIMVSIISISSLGQLSAGIAFSSHLISVKNPALALNHFGELSGRTELVCSLVCDLAISASLVYYFSVLRVGMERSQHVLQRLIILSVNMGVLLCLMTVITLILFQLDSGTFVSLSPHFILSKLYVNSLLATLNTRKHFRAIANRTFEFSLPDIPATTNIPASSQHDSDT